MFSQDLRQMVLVPINLFQQFIVVLVHFKLILIKISLHFSNLSRVFDRG